MASSLCMGVCFSMFVCAALSSAVLAASLSAPPSTPRLELTVFGGGATCGGRGPVRRSCRARRRPVRFPPRPPPSAVPPCRDTFSPIQIRCRLELQGAAQALVSPSAAPGAVRTYEAVLGSMVPKIADKLGSSGLLIASEDAFLAFFGAFLSLGPESAVRWNSVKLVKAVAAGWHVASGPRAASDREWPPQMRAFRNDLKRTCFHSSREKAPPPLKGDAWSA